MGLCEHIENDAPYRSVINFRHFFSSKWKEITLKNNQPPKKRGFLQISRHPKFRLRIKLKIGLEMDFTRSGKTPHYRK